MPLLKDLPGIRNLELELGGRYSEYSTGQDVPTYKAQLSWEPISWLRFRGGYNRAERTPNIAELYTTRTVSSQLTGRRHRSLHSPTWRHQLPQSNRSTNPDRAKLQAAVLGADQRLGRQQRLDLPRRPGQLHRRSAAC